MLSKHKGCPVSKLPHTRHEGCKRKPNTVKHAPCSRGLWPAAFTGSASCTLSSHPVLWGHLLLRVILTKVQMKQDSSEQHSQLYFCSCRVCKASSLSLAARAEWKNIVLRRRRTTKVRWNAGTDIVLVVAWNAPRRPCLSCAEQAVGRHSNANK